VECYFVDWAALIAFALFCIAASLLIVGLAWMLWYIFFGDD
jgi:hypothetical protein